VVSGNLQRQVHTLETALATPAWRPQRLVDPRSMSTTPPACCRISPRRRARNALRRRSARYFTAVRSALQAWAQQEDAPAGLESWRAFGDRVNAAADEVCAGLDQSDVVLVVTSAA